jgi:hypothetical protein
VDGVNNLRSGRVTADCYRRLRWAGDMGGGRLDVTFSAILRRRGHATADAHIGGCRPDEARMYLRRS